MPVSHNNGARCPFHVPMSIQLVNLVSMSIDALTALGLVLHYMSLTVHEIALQEIFAIVPASASCYITFGLKILLATLQEMPDAKILWPRGDEFQ
jgi:hypothetical protein